MFIVHMNFHACLKCVIWRGSKSFF